MKPERVRRIIEVAGLSAVVMSLLLVAYQIQQANRIAEATTLYEIVRDINQYNDMVLGDPAIADLIVELGRPTFSPSESQAKQVQALADRLLNNWVVQEVAYRNGLFDETQLSLTRNDVLGSMEDLPALLPYWHSTLSNQPAFASFEVLEPLLELQGE